MGAMAKVNHEELAAILLLFLAVDKDLEGFTLGQFFGGILYSKCADLMSHANSG